MDLPKDVGLAFYEFDDIADKKDLKINIEKHSIRLLQTVASSML